MKQMTVGMVADPRVLPEPHVLMARLTGERSVVTGAALSHRAVAEHAVIEAAA